jgi:hypothetical protein
MQTCLDQLQVVAQEGAGAEQEPRQQWASTVHNPLFTESPCSSFTSDRGSRSVAGIGVEMKSWPAQPQKEPSPSAPGGASSASLSTIASSSVSSDHGNLHASMPVSSVPMPAPPGPKLSPSPSLPLPAMQSTAPPVRSMAAGGIAASSRASASGHPALHPTHSLPMHGSDVLENMPTHLGWRMRSKDGRYKIQFAEFSEPSTAATSPKARCACAVDLFPAEHDAWVTGLCPAL